MFSYNKISQVHVELTNKCNAGCPTCPRSVSGAMTHPAIQLAEITLDQFISFFQDVVPRIQSWRFCGGYGDPCIANDTLQIMEYLQKTTPDTHIKIHSNGGMKNKEFWKELGKILSCEDKHIMTFSIDGLEDTNHLYRQYVNWPKLIENIESFISAGGIAHWDYLVFRHNELQVDEAKEFSKKLGFKYFSAKKPFGNFPYPVFNRQLKYTHTIEASTIDPNTGNQLPRQGKHIVDSERINNQKNSLIQIKNGVVNTIPTFNREEIFDDLNHYMDKDRENMLNSNIIKCRALGGKNHENNLKDGENEIYVTAHGFVLPCCWLGTDIGHIGYNAFEVKQIQGFIYKHGYNKINLHKNTLKKIYESNYFNKYTDSWDAPSIREGKLAACSLYCGKGGAMSQLYNWKKNGKSK